MANLKQFFAMSSLVLVLLCSFAFPCPVFGASSSTAAAAPPRQCGFEQAGGCHDKAEALRLKLIAFFAILMTSIVGVCSPIFSGSVRALKPDTDLFALVKAFASGVILATGYMHVMPDSFDDLTSPCLPEKPWRKFPFTTFVAMLSAVVTLMIDSFSMSLHKKHGLPIVGSCKHADENEMVEAQNFGQEGRVITAGSDGDEAVSNAMVSQLVRYRVVAQVLELGIIVHSVVIGLSLGTSENPCTIRPLVAALCFHQMFEGMGLGGCILQAQYDAKMKAIMVLFFSCTTPFGIALGIGLSKIYSPNSPTARIVVGLLNASSAGLLNYMALVDLLAADFMGATLQNSMKLQFWSFLAVLLGAGGMSVMALWA